MERDELVLHIEGPDGQIDAHAVVDGLNHLLKLLTTLPGSKDGSKNWTVSALSTGSATVGIMGRAERVSLAFEGLRSLHETASVPQGWDVSSVNALIDLGKVRDRRGVTGITLASADKVIVKIDDVLLTHAEKSIAPPPPSLGSIRGVLFRYNDDARTAGIRDRISELAVTVNFPDRLAVGLRQALTQEVLVWGDVHRAVGGRVDHVNVEGFEVVGLPRHRSVGEIAGLFGDDWTAGMSSVDWVRGQRDE